MISWFRSSGHSHRSARIRLQANERSGCDLLPVPSNGTAAASFDPRLESLRGLAALVVCIQHGMSVFAVETPSMARVVILSGFNSAAAVIFFFVLSGYVLGRALERDSAFASYLIRRLFRVLPTFVAAVLFAFACERLLRIDPVPSGLTPGFARMFWPEPTWDALRDNLMLVSFTVNGPTWTLLPELLGSLMLPFVVAAHASVPPRGRWALFAAIGTLLAISPFHALLWFYSGWFIAGEIAARLAGRRHLAVMAFVAGLVCLGILPLCGDFYAVGIVIPSAIAGAVTIGAVASSPDLLRWTTAAPLRFLGRVSYSLYLVHWPIFYLCALLAVTCRPVLPTEIWGNLFVTVTSVIVALAVAALSYRFIEAPSIRVGKLVASTPARIWARIWSVPRQAKVIVVHDATSR